MSCSIHGDVWCGCLPRDGSNFKQSDLLRELKLRETALAQRDGARDAARMNEIEAKQFRRLRKAVMQHLIGENGHLKSCGGACDPDCEDIRAALKEGT